jgi:putative ABC transport system ATP-binding protein
MLLEAYRLTRRYGSGGAIVNALRETSFEIHEGEFVAIMGPSGSGKSTLMNLIGLLDRPTTGRLVFAGEDTSRFDHDRLASLRGSRIGFVFQAYNLLARNTTSENVEMPLLYSGLPRKKRRLMAREALETVGLSHRLDHWPGELSGGEQQRVAIARALVAHPSVILADEPTGALDSSNGESILALLQSLNQRGRTIVLVTHDRHVASHTGRILQLHDGGIVDDQRVSEPVVARLQPAPDPGGSALNTTDRIAARCC